jgi:acetyl-CoA carboxylase carboxyl transferase subunit alpha
MAYDLEFEKPLAELDKKISALQRKGDRLKAEDLVQLQDLEKELHQKTEEIYHGLTPWQTVMVARHKDRPYSADYIRLLTDDFFELHGDRSFGDDHAIIAGPATLGNQPVMLICHQNGRDMKEKQFRNLGMPHPEGYRKAYRLMVQAEKFGIPVVSLIDASGASPGLVDEERGQAEAIAATLYLMPRLRVPIVSIIIGEGGSGGALAIGIADRVLMLEHSIYMVAAPEAAASIMWRDSSYAPQAAEAMRISARELLPLGLIDEILPEPLGGAHRNYHQMSNTMKDAILRHLKDIQQLSVDEMLEQRYQKFRAMGKFGSINAQIPAVSEVSSSSV